MSAQNATKNRAQAAAARPPLAPVLVSFAAPASQSRLTVLLRAFLVIPQFVVLALAGVAAGVVMLIGWIGALATGRLPGFAAGFLTGYVRWHTRVYAYALLLTDVYPPFSLAEADYPVQVTAIPGRLNRVAVLFRYFLLIPCWLVLGLVGLGAFTVVQVVSWLIVLISGQMPDALHQSVAAVLRFEVRTAGYAAMLTSAYPGGLFGDPGMDPAASPTRPSRRTPSPEQGSLLVLSDAARRLVGGFLVLGVVIIATAGIVIAVLTSGPTGASASARLTSDAVPVSNAVNNYSANVKACGGKLDCVTKLDRQVAATLSTFTGQLRGIQMPSQANAANAALISAVAKGAGIFSHLGAQTNATQYIKYASTANLNGSLTQINEDYAQVTMILGG